MQDLFFESFEPFQDFVLILSVTTRFLDKLENLKAHENCRSKVDETVHETADTPLTNILTIQIPHLQGFEFVGDSMLAVLAFRP